MARKSVPTVRPAVCPSLNRQAYANREDAQEAGVKAIRNDALSALYTVPCGDHFHWVRTIRLPLVRIPREKVQV